jgi:intergrase/recombinase
MRQTAVGADFYFAVAASVPETPAAAFAQRIKRAKTKQTVERFFVCARMTGEVFTFVVGEKAMRINDLHYIHSFF